jgi:hypothetical protein
MSTYTITSQVRYVDVMAPYNEIFIAHKRKSCLGLTSPSNGSHSLKNLDHTKYISTPSDVSPRGMVTALNGWNFMSLSPDVVANHESGVKRRKIEQIQTEELESEAKSLMIQTILDSLSYWDSLESSVLLEVPSIISTRRGGSRTKKSCKLSCV